MSGLIRVDELCGERPEIAGIRRVHFTSLGGLVGTILSPQLNSWEVYTIAQGAWIFSEMRWMVISRCINAITIVELLLYR